MVLGEIKGDTNKKFLTTSLGDVFVGVRRAWGTHPQPCASNQKVVLGGPESKQKCAVESPRSALAIHKTDT
jgi:hypothetical protein